MKAGTFLAKNETHVKTTAYRNKMLSDLTRIRIIMLLRKYKELCPTAIVKVLQARFPIRRARWNSLRW